ncbi:hypothetical protein B0J13DRAFT_557496 [Dactylonectria estremocensis]|uniref:GH16 domain-containing protein n=1 Tax=Dactylonectria estremocensis TaxID=1079267 RepID=A0A9P9J327_9HYPO|nr:hypothetical protein B0J13DRAFT_557496 [Dactylonectria estremocensis]
MLVKTSTIFQSLAAVLLVASENVEAHPAPDSSHLHTHIARSTFKDEFTTFDTNTWRCEYTCPVIETGKARYRLKSGVAPDNYGSWSKSRYTPQRFTKGNFTVSFSLTERPTKQPVWWGVALWDDGPTADLKQFNEINFGYTTDQSYTNTQLLFESAKHGVYSSLKIDTGVDLYSEEYHTASLVYDASHVAFYFDGKKLKEITNTSVIPTDEMDLVLGPRLVTGGSALTQGFTQSVDWVQITV